MAFSGSFEDKPLSNETESKSSDIPSAAPERVKKELLTPEGHVLSVPLVKRLLPLKLPKGYYKKQTFVGSKKWHPRSVAVDEFGNLFGIYTDPEEKTSTLVGKGSYGKLRLAELASGEWCVQKTVSCTDNQSHTYLEASRELAMLRELNLTPTPMETPIATVSNKYRTPTYKFKFFMKLVPGLSLDQLLFQKTGKSLPTDPKQLLYIATNFLKELITLHEEKKVLHRDIKKENIMIDSTGKVTLVDFGFARRMDVNRQFIDDTFYYTWPTVAPELIDSDRQGKMLVYSEATETFAAGVVLYALLFGQIRRLSEEKNTPYWDQNYTCWPDELKTKIYVSNVETKKIEYQFSYEIWETVRTMIKIDPQERPSPSNALVRLEKHLRALEPEDPSSALSIHCKRA